jgi:hypothetical protein
LKDFRVNLVTYFFFGFFSSSSSSGFTSTGENGSLITTNFRVDVDDRVMWAGSGGFSGDATLTDARRGVMVSAEEAVLAGPDLVLLTETSTVDDLGEPTSVSVFDDVRRVRRAVLGGDAASKAAATLWLEDSGMGDSLETDAATLLKVL